MPQKYIHYFGNESSESLLEAYGIVTKDNISITSLNPKICNQCGESNTQDARFCSKCKTIMSFEGYQEVLEEQKKKEDKLAVMEDKFNEIQSQMQALLSIIGSVKSGEQKREIAKRLIEERIYEA
jgi:ribosomal protein L40E